MSAEQLPPLPPAQVQPLSGTVSGASFEVPPDEVASIGGYCPRRPVQVVRMGGSVVAGPSPRDSVRRLPQSQLPPVGWRVRRCGGSLRGSAAPPGPAPRAHPACFDSIANRTPTLEGKNARSVQACDTSVLSSKSGRGLVKNTPLN